MHSLDSNKLWKLILLLGQSNALGQNTDPANLTGGFVNYGDEFPAVRIAQQLSCPIDSGVAACAFEWTAHNTKARINSVGEFGPEIGIVRAIPNIRSHTASGQTVIVKCATGSSDLANDWDETAATGMVLYSRMKAFIEHPSQVWADSYETAGAIWVQGESDALIQVEADAYEANLNSFIAQLRTDVGNSALPFIISRLHTSNAAAFGATVRTAEDDVAAADANVTTVTPTPGLSGDLVHYTENGYAELGDTDLGPALDAFYSECTG